MRVVRRQSTLLFRRHEAKGLFDLMFNNGTLTSLDLTVHPSPAGHSVRFDEKIYTDRDVTLPPDRDADLQLSSDAARSEEGAPSLSSSSRRTRRRRSGILKRRENTLTTAGAPPIILSDEGLKAGRVSPFINFPLFISTTVRSIGIIFGDM